MAKERTLSGLAHDTLDHALGPFGWLHPHVWAYAGSLSLTEVVIDLLSDPAISTRQVPEPLRLASSGLQSWFREHLEIYGFPADALSTAVLRFDAFGSHAHAFAATVTITSRSGRVFFRRSG